MQEMRQGNSCRTPTAFQNGLGQLSTLYKTL